MTEVRRASGGLEGAAPELAPPRRLLYATRAPFAPDAAGGAEISNLALFQLLVRGGWEVEVLCESRPRESWARAASQAELTRRGVASRVLLDTQGGIACRRVVARTSALEALRSELDARLDARRPDAVLGGPDPDCPLLARALERGLPTFFLAHNLAAAQRDRPLPRDLRVVANAPITAQRLAALVCGEIPVVLPVVEPQRYRADRRSGDRITFVNPIPEKGVAVALEVARRMPEARFLFVEGAWPGRTERSGAEARAAARSLPNVEIWGNRRDMREVYAATDLLLVPSQVEETFGRVILEAHGNAIPVVAADTAGIRYVLGRGGVLVDPPDAVGAYVNALERLRGSPELRAELSRAALANSRRPEFDPMASVRRFAGLLQQAIASRSDP